FVFTQGGYQHFADVIVGAHAQTGECAHLVEKVGHYHLHILLLHVRQLGHGGTYALHFFWPHVLEDFRRIALPQGHQQNRGLIHIAEFAFGFFGRFVFSHGALLANYSIFYLTRVVTYSSLLIQLLTTWATRPGSSAINPLMALSCCS